MFLWQSTSTLGSLAALLRQFDRLVDGAPAKGARGPGDREIRPQAGDAADPRRHRGAIT